MPIKRKKAIRIASFNRFSLKIGLVVIFAIALFVVFLFSNLFIINIYSKINEDEINRTGSEELNNLIQKTKTEIDNYHTKTNQSIKEIKQRDDYWVYLNQINLLLPEKIYYSKIVMEADKISLEGMAKNRDDLVSFKEALEQIELFKEVEMPISNFTSQEDVSFKISLVVNKK